MWQGCGGENNKKNFNQELLRNCLHPILSLYTISIGISWKEFGSVMYFIVHQVSIIFVRMLRRLYLTNSVRTIR